MAALPCSVLAPLERARVRFRPRVHPFVHSEIALPREGGGAVLEGALVRALTRVGAFVVSEVNLLCEGRGAALEGT